MPMTKPGKFDSKGAWDGFRGEIWQEEINVRDFIQKNCGIMYRNFRKKKEKRVAFWNAKQKLFPV